MDKVLPRGIRNNNPGNIRRSNEKWQGLSDKQDDDAFFQFTESLYGIRAMVKILMNYQDKYALKSIRQIISRWAPPNENDTQSYINSVTLELDVSDNYPIDVTNVNICLPLVRAIIRHENGQQPYSDTVIKKAIALATNKA